MKNKISILLALFSLILILSSCEKDGELVYFTNEITPPILSSVPVLDLKMANAADTLVFSGTPIEAGFSASARYYLETCETGNDFADVIRITFSDQDSAINVTVSELNDILIKSFSEFETISMDFRIRAILVVDAGTGAPGTTADPFESISETVTQNVTTYGLPRMDVINSGLDQSLKLTTEEGVFSSIIKLDVTKPFTLFDPSTQISYGGNNGKLIADGDAIIPTTDGWNEISVNTVDMTYELDPFSIGIVGAFTEWGTLPDVVLDYDAETKIWSTTVDLPTGPMKFRKNSDWSLNWGPGIAPDTDVDLPADGKMDLLNEWGNINIVVPGEYSIELTINGTAGYVEFTINE